MSDLDNALRRAHQMADRVASALEGKPVDVTRRKLLAGAAFQLSTEHHRAMILLIENGAIGSALALLRPLFEAYALGHWLRYFASDQKVDQFAAGRFRPTLNYLLRVLVNHNPGGPTHAAMQRLAARAHDLTHGGAGHLVRRMGPTRLGPSYHMDEVVISLDVATWVAGMSTLDLVGAVIEDETTASALTGEFRTILGWLPDTPAAANAPDPIRPPARAP